MITVEQLEAWIQGRENEHLEFKEAANRYDFEKLVKYCCALANEGGGRFILGVSDRRPRRVVGSAAFEELERTKLGLVERLRIRVDGDEVQHPGGRVVVFSVPSRPVGMPIQYEGAYWMRAGESLMPMTPDVLRRIFDESGPDFSAQVCAGATVADLDPAAIARYRRAWAKKANNPSIERLSDAQTLADAELVVDAGVTYAALVLLGRRAALGMHLPQAEVVFEYRSSEATGPAQQRKEYREGFFCFYDVLWATINLRNELQHFQDGLFIWDVPTFNEVVVREALLNAISHRDYRLGGSVFVRQYPSRLEIVSPGGLPTGIDVDNILWRQAPRNRRIAEAFARCGLVDRSGQGMNRMFEESIRQGKPAPDFRDTDAWQVALTLHGQIRDARFLKFLERIGTETLASFTTEHFLALDLVHTEQPLPERLQGALRDLIGLGVVERVGRGRGASHILSRKFQTFLGQKGTYTRKRGLDHDTNKELLYKHVVENATDGSRMEELMQVLPHLSRAQVKRLMDELRTAGRVRLEGKRRGARWYPA